MLKSITEKTWAEHSISISQYSTIQKDLFCQLARSELNSIEKIISKALIDSVISHGEFAVAFNEEQNYRILKDSIRAKDDQLGDIESDRLIDHRKKIRQN